MHDDDLWARAHRDAARWLRRYRDDFTLRWSEDLAQDATFATWQWVREGRTCERLWAAVQTITMRLRGRALRAARQRFQQGDLAGLIAPGAAEERWYRVAGRRIPVTRLKPWLLEALGTLSRSDRGLLLSFYEGFSCDELAERFCRSLACVKTRLHRARRRVQKHVEEHARKAGGFDG